MTVPKLMMPVPIVSQVLAIHTHTHFISFIAAALGIS